MRHFRPLLSPSQQPKSSSFPFSSLLQYPDAWNAWFTADYAYAIAAIVLGVLSVAALLWKCCCGGCCGEKVVAETEEPTATWLDSEGARSREESV